MDRCGTRGSFCFLFLSQTGEEVLPILPIALARMPTWETIERHLIMQKDVLMLLPFPQARRLKKDYPDNCVLISTTLEGHSEDISMIDYMVPAHDLQKLVAIIQAEQSRRMVINVQANHALRRIYQDTATAIVLNETQTEILLIKREDNGRWFPPGGHVNRGELPSEAVLREVREETGFCARFLHQPDNVGEEFDSAIVLPQPFCMLLEDLETHSHHDCVYLCALTEQVGHAEGETRWFSLEEIQAIESVPEDVKRVAASLLRTGHPSLAPLFFQ